MTACAPGPFSIVPFLHQLPQACKPTRFSKGQTLFAQGDLADSIFLVEQGMVKVAITSTDGQEAVIALLGKGSLCGEIALAWPKPLHPTSAVARTEVSALKIDPLPIRRLLHVQPELCDAVLGSLIKSNVQLQYDLASNLLHTAEERLARILSSLVESHKSGNNPVPRITQQELAHMIGITRQRVNAMLKKFRQSGRIEGSADLTLNRSPRRIALQGKVGTTKIITKPPA